MRKNNIFLNHEKNRYNLILSALKEDFFGLVFLTLRDAY